MPKKYNILLQYYHTLIKILVNINNIFINIYKIYKF